MSDTQPSSVSGSRSAGAGPAPAGSPPRDARRIAHDINNTLGTIVGNLELVRMDLDPAHPATESIVEIRKATARARDLVKELFALDGGMGPDPAAREVEQTIPPANPIRGSGQHILYLDDEEPQVFLASNLFQRLGYRVSGFTDPQSAWDAFALTPEAFDLVVTDFNLRSISGIDVARRMIELQPRQRIILATGELTEAVAEQAKDVGIRHVLYKPNTIEALCQAIHRLATGP